MMCHHFHTPLRTCSCEGDNDSLTECLSVTDSLYPLSEGALKRVGKVENKKIRRGKKCGITHA